MKLTLHKRDVVAILKAEMARVLPEKPRNPHNSKHPLWAWLRGAHAKRGPRVFQVVANQAQWPWTTQNAAGYNFVKRWGRGLTWIQLHWLLNYTSRRYPGVYKHSRGEHYGLADVNGRDPQSYAGGDWASQARAMGAGRKTQEYFADVLSAVGVVGDVPLRLILSQELACLIQIKFLEFYK